MQLSLRLRLVPLVSLALLASSPPHTSDKRVHLRRTFTPGGVLRYSIETRTSSTEHTTTPIINPEGASLYKQSTSLIVRLDVLDVQPSSAQASAATVRFRATFEQARAESQADAFAPEAGALDDAIENLETHSFEFSIDSANNVTRVTGLDQIAPNREVAARVLSWMRVLCSSVDLPRDGIDIGQKWNSERPLTDVPLSGLIWHNESSYLRNEPCSASSPAQPATGATATANNAPRPGSASPPPMQDDCAVLLTRFSILRHGSERSDATPEEYLRNGLRTSGKWTASGESLSAISLASGLLVSSTQSATQDMDYVISSASSGSRIHHVGRTTTQTEITALPIQPRLPS
jgi:hypothetical protein